LDRAADIARYIARCKQLMRIEGTAHLAQSMSKRLRSRRQPRVLQAQAQHVLDDPECFASTVQIDIRHSPNRKGHTPLFKLVDWFPRHSKPSLEKNLEGAL
jgi:hypothetical protein